MLARQPERDAEPDISPDVPANRVKLVGELLAGPGMETPVRRRRRLPFIGDAISRLREEARLQPERYAQLVDRLILLGITVVVLVSAYILIVDPS